MVIASAVLMLAGSPQTFLGVASAQESLLLVVEILAVYGRHVSNELGRANFGASLRPVQLPTANHVHSGCGGEFAGLTEVLDKSSLDDAQPSTLVGGGKSTVYPTLQEAMMAWHRLPPEQARKATIRGAGDRVYTPIEIVRFHHRLKTT